ncbi:MAG: hypothetical protein M3483_06000 [Gemmatimonadota bacterium]|nr:hypothetical protein [Gemmatimonadota bacterium]
MEPIDLAAEMAAARKRREEQTARLLREARVQMIRAAVRPGSTREEIEERARSCYPRLSPELLEEAVSIVCDMHRSPPSEKPAVG